MVTMGLAQTPEERAAIRDAALQRAGISEEIALNRKRGVRGRGKGKSRKNGARKRV